MAIVKGGDSETVTRLAAKQFPTPDIMQLWGEAVYYNPDFLSTKVTDVLFPAVFSTSKGPQKYKTKSCLRLTDIISFFVQIDMTIKLPSGSSLYLEVEEHSSLLIFKAVQTASFFTLLI